MFKPKNMFNLSVGVDTGAWTERCCAALRDQHVHICALTSHRHFCVIFYINVRYVQIKVQCLNKRNEHNTRGSSLIMFHFERFVI